MTYSVTWPLGNGATFTISNDNPGKLADEFRSLSGDDSLLQRAKEAAKNPPEPVPTVTASASASGARQAAVSDPWASEGPRDEDAPLDDPWAEPTNARPTQSAQREPSRSSNPQASAVSVQTDRFKREWTTGLPDVPNCDCGEPGAQVKQKSKAGNYYTKIKCAKGAPGGNWQDKCNYDEFPD